MFQHCATACLEDEDLGGIGYFVINENPSTTLDAVEACRDSDANCEEFVEAGECNSNPDYMLQECAKSCLACFDKE